MSVKNENISKIYPEKVPLDTDQGILESEERKWGLPLKEVYKHGLSFYKEKEGKALHLSYEDRLKLVAYTQQTAHGPLDIKSASPLGVLDVIGRDRRAAWQALGQMSQIQAMAGFVHTLDRLCPLFKPYLEAIQKDLETKKQKQFKKEQDERAHLELQNRIMLEKQKQQNTQPTEEQQVQRIKDALNAQTYEQFLQYAQQQFPGNFDQQAVLIRQLQDKHYQQYIQQLAVDQRLSNTELDEEENEKSKEEIEETVTDCNLNETDILKRLFSLAEPEKWTLTGAIGFLIVSSSVTMAVPFSLGKVLDIIYDSSNDLGAAREKLDALCLMLCGVFLLGGFCNFARVYLMSISGQRMTQSLRKQVYGAIMRQEPAWFGRNSTGELINRLSADTQLVGRNLSQNLSDGLRSFLMVCAGTGMMFYMSPSLAMIGLCVVPPVSILAVFYGRFVRGITRQMQDTLAETSELAEEKISNIKTVKAFSKEKSECKVYAQRIENLLKLAYKESMAVGSFYGLTGLSGNMIIILVLYYGGGMVATEQLTVGNLTSFLLYAAYVGISIGGLSSFYTELNKGIGAATRLWQIIDRVPTIPVEGGRRPLHRPQGEIVFENICYSYQGAPLIKDFNLHLRPGKSVALVGRSGCGKSTIAALILRLYDPDKGKILLDGVDIKELDPTWLRSHIGFVSQEPVLFSGSIKDNILYGALEDEHGNIRDSCDAKEPAWLAAARTAYLHELVVANTAGWGRQVGAGGGQLSGGQKQRVAIARAIVKNPKILILDEATSALDAYSEFLVDKSLKEISRDRTVLTIAHRLSTIQSADEVAVLENGSVIENGTYTELMAKQDGFFRELITHQTFASKNREPRDKQTT
ncbi:ATP-binding cassette sub-family B member 10, mitochondrial-like [Plodia interpunctella]|uniref:ATP-binding cassette sub-family B member 10, mitochondrial-like n=1 Tax=Plodia interpunctella TaxID=58824 RepID=UPI0023684CA6|nr:ATP-binding cassette sub-family B member 10, mitochondrial-like [Plodia interpunctella]